MCLMCLHFHFVYNAIASQHCLCPSSIQFWGSNSQPLSHEPSALFTRPQLLAFIDYFITEFFFHVPFLVGDLSVKTLSIFEPKRQQQFFPVSFKHFYSCWWLQILCLFVLFFLPTLFLLPSHQICFKKCVGLPSCLNGYCKVII